MFGKQLKFAIRSLKKNILYSLFVMVGLAIGTATFISTIQWSAWHLTFDRSYPENERIYRLTFEENYQGFYRHTARILHGTTLNKLVFSDMLTGVESVARLAPFRKAAFRIGEDSFYDLHTYGCDPAFLEIFQPTILHGDRNDLLNEPFTAVLTETTAKRFYGDRNPVGSSFELIHQFDVTPVTYTVTGVIKDFPDNSHFKISILTSFEAPIGFKSTAWAYMKLTPPYDAGTVEESIKLFLTNSIESEDAERITPHLQSVSKIHLHSHKAREIQPNIRFRTALVVMLTGMMVFILAWFNFTLLSFSQNQLHIQRHVIQWQMGAGKNIFLRQFTINNLVIGGVSFVAGILITILLVPAIEKQGGSFMFQDTPIIIGSILILLVLIALSSLIASVISTGRIYQHLQRRYLSSKLGARPDNSGKNLFIRAVIVIEFTLTFILVSNLLMITQQTKFAMSKQLGATQKEALHLHSLHREIINQFELFKERMLESPHVANVTASMEEPTGQAMDANTFELEGVDEGGKQLFLFPVDQDFFSLLWNRNATWIRFPGIL